MHSLIKTEKIQIDHLKVKVAYLSELKRITKAVINMRLSRKVHDCVDFLDIENVINQFGAADVALHELVVRIIFYLTEIFKTRAI
jgi:hypothetical protein